MAATTRVTVRLDAATTAQLDELCRARGLRRPAMLRALIAAAHVDPPAAGGGAANDGELHALLSAEARGGSVPAMRELRILMANRRPRVSPSPVSSRTGFDELDELAVRRARSAGGA